MEVQNRSIMELLQIDIDPISAGLCRVPNWHGYWGNASPVSLVKPDLLGDRQDVRSGGGLQGAAQVEVQTGRAMRLFIFIFNFAYMWEMEGR